MLTFEPVTRRAPKPAPRPLRVLVGCEESGIVRRAFAKLGHDAWSCDLKPSRDRSNKHIVGDIRDILHDGWDLLAVIHPPCTRLCNSGVRWLNEPPGKLNPEHHTQQEILDYQDMSREQRLALMWRKTEEGAALFSACWNAPIERVCVENPVMHKHAKAMITNYRDAAQHVQPWQFGEPAFKSTGLYLRGLDCLEPTNILTPPKPGTPEHKAWSFIHLATPGDNRSEVRSTFFEGIADAMAAQWAGQAD